MGKVVDVYELGASGGHRDNFKNKKLMRMKMRRILGTLFLMCSIVAYAQKQEKIYYGKDWKGCSRSKAEFYRVVNYDESEKPVGKVKDYFITGELQAEIEGALYMIKLTNQNQNL